MVITLPYITTELSGTYSEYGIFMAGFPLGYVFGTMVVSKLKHSSRRALMLGSLIVGGLTYVSLGLNHSIIFAVITEVIAGISMSIFNIHNITILQKSVPNDIMGKVSSVRLLVIRGVMPLGVFLGGIISKGWGIRPSYLLIGGIICLFSLLGMILPYFKFIDSEQLEEDVAS